MEGRAGLRPRPVAVLRVALALFVLAWIFGPYALRAAVPVWLVFGLALALEVGFFLGALRAAPARPRDRGPQAIDRERYGYAGDADDAADADAESDDAEDAEADARAPAPPEAGRRWTPVRRLAAGLAVIATLAGLLWVVERRTGWEALSAETRADAAARFSREASRIAGKPVTIRCDESGRRVGAVQHADGVAVVGGELAYLTPDRCLDLYRLAFRGEVRSSQTARSLAVLAHEAWHLRGVRDEGATECYALQSGVELGERLGLSERRARQLMRQQLAENALRDPASAEYVVPPDCREGGGLDLGPRDTRFP